MTTYIFSGHIPPVFIGDVVDAESLEEAVKNFRIRYPRAEIDVIDSRAICGDCEVCGMPVFLDSPHFADSEEVVLHSECAEKNGKTNNE